MNKQKCIVLADYPGAGGIIIKAGTICEVLANNTSFIWINPFIEELGEEIPLPIYECYVQYI